MTDHADHADHADRSFTPDVSPDIVAMILSAIAEVAPELRSELADLDHDVDFWVELQLDSMDHLAVMTRLSEQTGVDIAERDYPHLTTITALRDFLTTR